MIFVHAEFGADAAEVDRPEEPGGFSESHDTATAVAEPIVRSQRETEGQRRTRKQPPYNVILLNDDVHSFEYVIELLVKVFAHSVRTAEQLTEQIHTKGRAIALTTHKELAELKCEQVQQFGADPWASTQPKGPLGCYIEPAAG